MSGIKLFGRSDEMSELLDAWDSGKRIFGIFGAKMIGKSKLMEEFVHRLDEMNDLVEVVKIDFKTVRNFKNFGNIISEIFGINLDSCSSVEDGDEMYTNLCDCILQRCKCEGREQKKIVFVLDNLEHTRDKVNGGVRSLLTQSFWDRLWEYIFNPILDRHKNTHVVLSTTETLRFAQKRYMFFGITISRLDFEASAELVKSEWQNVPDGDVTKLVTFCKGHPQSLVNLVIMLKDAEGIQLSIDDAIQHLQDRQLDLISDTFLPSTDKVDLNIARTIEKLCSSDKENLCKIAVITLQKAYRADEMAVMLGYGKEIAKFKFDVLWPLYGRNLLEIDRATKKLACHHLVKETIREHYQNLIDLKGIAETAVLGITRAISNCDKTKTSSEPREHQMNEDVGLKKETTTRDRMSYDRQTPCEARQQEEVKNSPQSSEGDKSLDTCTYFHDCVNITLEISDEDASSINKGRPEHSSIKKIPCQSKEETRPVENHECGPHKINDELQQEKGNCSVHISEENNNVTIPLESKEKNNDFDDMNTQGRISESFIHPRTMNDLSANSQIRVSLEENDLYPSHNALGDGMNGQCNRSGLIRLTMS